MAAGLGSLWGIVLGRRGAHWSTVGDVMKFGTKPLTAKDQIDEWIASVVPNQTFADVGGIGVNSVNERLTFAIKCGAKSATMVDFRPSDYYEWDLFRRICAQKG